MVSEHIPNFGEWYRSSWRNHNYQLPDLAFEEEMVEAEQILLRSKLVDTVRVEGSQLIIKTHLIKRRLLLSRKSYTIHIGRYSSQIFFTDRSQAKYYPSAPFWGNGDFCAGTLANELQRLRRVMDFPFYFNTITSFLSLYRFGKGYGT